MATVCEDEQVFYERHFETLQKTVDSSRKVSRPGVVGPLGAPPTNDLTRIDTKKVSFYILLTHPNFSFLSKAGIC